MNLLAELRRRFDNVLSQYCDHPADFLGMIRPAQDTRFGDYQANFAMPLAGKAKRPARELADEIAANVEVSDLCKTPEVAGPGFINLTVADKVLLESLSAAFVDDRLGVPLANPTQTVVIDFSSPNVAKPMHVGHIRSTVIGDSLARVSRFLGHRVITDNHLGDWGTQFGMIIYGYKHFRDDQAYSANPVGHLSGLYRLVRQLADFHEAKRTLPAIEQNRVQLADQQAKLKSEPEPKDKAERKKHLQELQRLDSKIQELAESIDAAKSKIASVESDAKLKSLADQHSGISRAVLDETAKLHSADSESIALWNEFLPYCRQDIQRIYDRLGIEFDHELGESFYHDQLAGVVDALRSKDMASISDGAVCVFLDGFAAPMLIQKSDGAFLYATTDLATIQYRMKNWKPDVILYVVDHRQHEHFQKLFAAAQKWGYNGVDLRHVSFGTVLGEDGKPFKTRAGDTVGLESLLDEAERRALSVLDKIQSEGNVLSDEEKSRVSKIIGIGALKFADLSQHRASDYKFSYDKMLELKGFTATYLQYLYARVQGIYRRAEIDPQSLAANPRPFVFSADVERQLGLSLLRFSEALDDVLVDQRPNILAQYLFELTQTFFKFYDQCKVLEAESDDLKTSRLQFCELTARTVRKGLELLGIGVVEKM